LDLVSTSTLESHQRVLMRLKAIRIIILEY
jgi:hypothetical protein